MNLPIDNEATWTLAHDNNAWPFLGWAWIVGWDFNLGTSNFAMIEAPLATNIMVNLNHELKLGS